MANLLVMKFDAAKAAASVGLVVRREQALFIASVRATMVEVGKIVRRRVTADIYRAGNFSQRWPTAFVIDNSFKKTNAIMRTGFSPAIPYAHVHEFGATIRGRPLLWIPLPWNPSKVRARNFPGQLFRVERAGRNPLLFSKADKQAKYVGVAQVRLRPRFHIRSIVANVVRTQLAKLFKTFILKGQSGRAP